MIAAWSEAVAPLLLASAGMPDATGKSAWLNRNTLGAFVDDALAIVMAGRRTGGQR